MNLLIKYQQKLAEQVEPWGNQAVLIFRGQSDKSWKLDSGADRRLEKETQPPSLIEYLHKVLIEPARSEGYAHRENRNLNDLELLAKLQHHGAATCLIDFTANFHIALWFACAGDKTDGKVFVVNRGGTQNFKEVTPERAEKGIAELLLPQPAIQQLPSEVIPKSAKEDTTELPQLHSTTRRFASSEKQPEISYWKPPANENRIVVQHSCFIFSAYPIKPETYKEISISKEHKQEIRILLEKYYGLDRQSIFRDFGGFAASQGQDQPITPIDPTSEQPSLRSGNRHFQQGKYDKAIEEYNEAIRINSQCDEAYVNRGTVKGMLNRHEEAIADFNEAIRINPQSTDTYINRGTAKAKLGRYEEAIADFSEAIRINPQSADTYTNKGIVKGTLGRYEEAIADFNEAIRINPQDAEAYTTRGIIKDRHGRHEEAITDFNEAIRINPQDAEAYYNRAVTKAALGQHHDAIADYDRAIRINPQDAVAHNNRGIAKAALDQHHDAIADYDQAIRINPQFADAYYNRGIAKDVLGQPHQAIADYDQAIRINPQSAEVYYNRGTLKGMLGRYEEAIADFNKAIRINSQFAQAYYNRGNANKEIEEYKKARADLQRAFELATEQGNQELARHVQRLLDQLPPAGGED